MEAGNCLSLKIHKIMTNRGLGRLKNQTNANRYQVAPPFKGIDKRIRTVKFNPIQNSVQFKFTSNAA